MIFDWAYRKPYYEKRRDRNYANGLTATGQPRHRPWQHLTGLTPEQKRQRRLAQQRAWSREKWRNRQ